MLPNASRRPADEGSGTASTLAKKVRTFIVSNSVPPLKKKPSTPYSMTSPSERPDVSKKTSAMGEFSVRKAPLGSENEALAPKFEGVKLVEAPLKMPRPEMFTTGGGGDTPPKNEKVPTPMSKESTAGKLVVPSANNTKEAFGPIPIDDIFEPFEVEIN